jgi:hypothetical protein
MIWREFVPSRKGMLFAFNVLAPVMVRDDPKKPGQTEPPSTSERWNYAGAPSDDVVSVRLIRKFAEHIDGVNLENATVGELLDLPPRDANILIAEGWAVQADDERLLPRSLAADSSRRSRKKPGKS